MSRVPPHNLNVIQPKVHKILRPQAFWATISSLSPMLFFIEFFPRVKQIIRKPARNCAMFLDLGVSSLVSRFSDQKLNFHDFPDFANVLMIIVTIILS